MNPVLKGFIVYVFILVIFRFMGKKSLSETTSNALTGNDYSLITCLLLVCTLTGTDFLLGKVKLRFPHVDKIIDGVPLILVENGKLLDKRMKKAGVDTDDILEAARMTQGLEKLRDIKYAVLEKDGTISIIPNRTKETA